MSEMLSPQEYFELVKEKKYKVTEGDLNRIYDR